MSVVGHRIQQTGIQLCTVATFAFFVFIQVDSRRYYVFVYFRSRLKKLIVCFATPLTWFKWYYPCMNWDIPIATRCIVYNILRTSNTAASDHI